MARYSKGQKVEFMPHGAVSKPHDASTKGYHNYEHAGYIIDVMTDRGGRFIGEYAVQDTTRNHVEVVKEGDILRSE